MVKFVIGAACRGGLVAGPFFLVFALITGLQTHHFIKNSSLAKGTIEEIVPAYGEGHQVSGYAPVFSFVTSDGESRTVTGAVTTGATDFKVGQSVRVLYEKSDPQSARLAIFWQVWSGTLNYGITGTAAFIFGYLLLRFERRRNPRGWSFWLGPL